MLFKIAPLTWKNDPHGPGCSCDLPMPGGGNVIIHRPRTTYRDETKYQDGFQVIFEAANGGMFPTVDEAKAHAEEKYRSLVSQALVPATEEDVMTACVEIHNKQLPRKDSPSDRT